MQMRGQNKSTWAGIGPGLPSSRSSILVVQETLGSRSSLVWPSGQTLLCLLF